MQNAATRHSWLTGLLKCGTCGYVVKVTRDSRSRKYHLGYSGRSNMGVCAAVIRVDPRELKTAVAQSLGEALKNCPPKEIRPAGGGADAELQQIEARTRRWSALWLGVARSPPAT